MEKNLTVTVTETAAVTADECVTPTDPGSRILPSTVCPPAPRKRPAVFYSTEDLDRTGPPSRKLSRRFSKVAIRLVFDVVECATWTEKEKTTVKDSHDETTADSGTDTTQNFDTSDC